MSPEQAAGDKSLDARTDQYSLASVLYEMLAGEAPWTGATAQAIAAKRLTEPPPSVRSVRPNVPAAVDDAIRQGARPGRGGPVRVARAVRPGPADDAAATERSASAPPGGIAAAAPPKPRRRIPIAASSLTLGLLIGLGVLFGWLRHRDDAPAREQREAARGAPVREPGRRRRRVLRRRRHRRGPGQADLAPRPPGDRPQQLDPVQEVHQVAPGDRPRARRGLAADRHGSLGEGRRRQPRAGEPRADPGLHRLDQVAAAVRRRAHRRVPGPGRHGRPGGPGAGPGARLAPARRPGGAAHHQRRGLRRLSQGRSRVAERGQRGLRGAPIGDHPLRAGRRPRLGLRPGLGPAVARALADLRQQRRPAGRARAAPWRRPSGRGAAAPSHPPGVPRAGGLLLLRRAGLPRALQEYEAGLRLAPNNGELLGATARGRAQRRPV